MYHFLTCFIRTSSNTLVLHGQHFGRTVFALCNYPALLTASILQLEELQDSLIKDYPADVQQEHKVFINLIDSYLGLLDYLTKGEEEDIIHVGELLGKGASGASGNNTKTLKSAILEWLVPKGQVVIPPLSWSIKSDHGFNHEVTGPVFLYAGYEYDPEDLWKGLLHSEILIFGYKHVFISPSSVDKEPKATRSGNAYLYGMKSVTQVYLAYITMQVQFSLRSSSVFSHTNTVTNSENFYHSILDLLEDPNECKEVADLMTWWMWF
ncbi:hypothetical protein BDR06DRAFT_985114 [Suillus hirtellus]|nr:hypothetical protein BDR06DRAFT_985114 [Suillus hirtellus]